MLITLLNIICVCWKAKSQMEVLLIFWKFPLEQICTTFNCNHCLFYQLCLALHLVVRKSKCSLINELMSYAYQHLFFIQIVIDKQSFINESASKQIKLEFSRFWKLPSRILWKGHKNLKQYPTWSDISK